MIRINKQLTDYLLSTKEEKYYKEKYNYIPVEAYIRMLSFGLLRDLTTYLNQMIKTICVES